MPQYSFSFVIPAFNASATLERCLAHIRAQAYPAHLLEVIVVDNGSTDETADIAAAKADQCIALPEARISGVRNAGARKARSDIFVFVDADCLLPEEFAHTANDIFQSPGVGMCGSKTHVLPDNAGWVAEIWKLHLDRSQLQERTQWLVTRALAVRRAAFEEVGGFDEVLETCEDVSFGHAIAENWEIIADARLSPLHLEDPDSIPTFLRKEIWRAQNSVQTSFSWIQERPLLLLTREGLSLILPFYFLVAALLLFLGFLSIFNTGSVLAFFFALLAFLAPISLLSLDTALKTERLDAFPRLAVLYTVYILAKVIALFYHGQRNTPRRVV